MSYSLTSTSAKVRDAEKVQEILAAFAMRSFQIELNNEGSIELVADPEFEPMPQAIKWEQVGDRDQYADLDDFFDARDNLFEKQGDDGFLALLLKLAPFLETPLLILWGTTDVIDVEYTAIAWTVQPGAKEVDWLQICG